MRFCENEDVAVFEATGESLGDLLRRAANVVDTHGGYANVHTAHSVEWGYSVIVYVHG